MAKREWPLRFECGHEGCRESVTYRYPTMRDRADSYELRNYQGGKWRCIRHSQPNEVLGPDNLEIKTAYTSERREHGIFWGSYGFMHGPGFKAFCADFPAGTKLIVTARIELPQPATEGGDNGGAA